MGNQRDTVTEDSQIRRSCALDRLWHRRGRLQPDNMSTVTLVIHIFILTDPSLGKPKLKGSNGIGAARIEGAIETTIKAIRPRAC